MDKQKTKERQKMDTTKSDKIVQAYLQKEPKYERRTQRFSGTFESTPKELFPLLCPTREADWVTGWDCELLYTESGYAEDKCVFKTEKSNPTGDGIWTFTGFEKNKSVEFVRLQENMLLHVRITVTDNGDGTVTATWQPTPTALNEEGNKEVANLEDGVKKRSGTLPKMIGRYLKKGKKISKAALVIGIARDFIRGH